MFSYVRLCKGNRDTDNSITDRSENDMKDFPSRFDVGTEKKKKLSLEICDAGIFVWNKKKKKEQIVKSFKKLQKFNRNVLFSV